MSGTKKDEETTAFFQVPEGLLRRARGEDAAPDTERQPGSLRPSTPSASVPAAAPTWDEPTAQSGQTHDDGHTLAVAAPAFPSAPPPSALPTRPPQRPLVDPPRLRRTSSRPLDPLPELEAKNEGPPEEDTLVNFQRDELLRRTKK
jgi:hypothetical protein